MSGPIVGGIGGSYFEVTTAGGAYLIVNGAAVGNAALVDNNNYGLVVSDGVVYMVTGTTEISLYPGVISITGLPVYPNNAAAIAGGLSTSDIYRTGADPDQVAIVDSVAGTSSSTLTIASGTFTLGTSSIPSDECVSVTGTVVNGSVSTIDPVCTSGHLCDTLTVNFAADPTGITGYPPSTTGTLTLVPVPEAAAAPQLKACNNTGSPIAPGLAVTYNWKYVR